MARSIALLVSLTAMLCWAAEDKSHDVWLTRLEKPILNEKWVVKETYKLNKVDKNRKSLNMNFTLLQDVTEDNMVCQLNVYQKNGGKYVKAPFHIPETPCCKLIKDDLLGWRCLRDNSNAPESCPIAAGFYQVNDFDPDRCDYPKNLPPNGAEDYKIDFMGSSGGEQVFRHVAYGVVKKRMQLSPL